MAKMAQFSSLSSSGVSSCYSEMDGRCSGDESDEEDAFISFTTTESKCERLYEQGLEFKCEGDLQESLSSFLKCLEGMQECQYFAKLPQTLNQLSDVYRSLQHLERAEDYSKAEKLFYEAIVTEPHTRTQASSDRQKTKRRVFGRKNRPASSGAVCNPAEYGNLLNKKAEGFERLARMYATECKFDLAQEYSSKAASIRKIVLGQRQRAASDYMLYSGCVSNIHTGPLKGDLSKVGQVGTICENVTSETSESTLYGDKSALYMSPTTGNSKTPYPPQYAPNMAMQPSLVQTENTLGNPSTANFPYEGTTTRGGYETSSNRRVASALCSYEEVGQETPHEDYKYHLPNVQECAHANIHRDPRQETVNGIPKDSEVDRVQRMDFHSDRVGSKGIGSQLPHRGNLCVTNNFSDLKKPMSMLSDLKNPLSKLSELKNPMCKLSEFRNPMSKLSELKNPMSKLSELKNPMCVNLDLHKSPGENVEPTRCLPLWILLLPAFLALVGYVMYYH